MSRKRPSHERMTHLFGFLAEFAADYPGLPEIEQALYRDLCRAALMALDDEQKAETLLLRRSVDEFLFRACREDVGTYLLRQLRKEGVNVRLVHGDNGLRLQVGPADKTTAAIRAKVQRWKQAIRDALLDEGLNDPAIVNHTPMLGNRVSSCGRAVPSDSQNGEAKQVEPTRERSTT